MNHSPASQSNPEVHTGEAATGSRKANRFAAVKRWTAHRLGFPIVSDETDAIVYPSKPSEDAQPKPETVQFIYEAVQRQIEMQHDQASALEGKAVTVLGSASLLTASAMALQAIVASHSAPLQGSHGMWARDLQFAALATYTIIVLTCTFAYRVRAYVVNPDPRTIRAYFYASVTHIQRVLLGNMATSFAKNQVLVDQKAWWTRKALAGLVLEGLLLAAAALVQILA